MTIFYSKVGNQQRGYTAFDRIMIRIELILASDCFCFDLAVKDIESFSTGHIVDVSDADRHTKPISISLLLS